MFNEDLIALNTLERDPNARGNVPLVGQLYLGQAMGAMVAGVKATDFDCKFGKGQGEVLGVIPLVTKGAGDNESLAFTVAAHSSTAGKITLTMHSSDATATDDLTISFIVVGRIYPHD